MSIARLKMTDWSIIKIVALEFSVDQLTDQSANHFIFNTNWAEVYLLAYSFETELLRGQVRFQPDYM